mgnify:FL=1
MTDGSHPIAGMGVPHRGCGCKNCHDARSANFRELMEKLRADPVAFCRSMGIQPAPWQEAAIRGMSKSNPLLRLDMARGPDRTEVVVVDPGESGFVNELAVVLRGRMTSLYREGMTQQEIEAIVRPPGPPGARLVTYTEST